MDPPPEYRLMSANILELKEANRELQQRVTALEQLITAQRAALNGGQSAFEVKVPVRAK
jgi:hypothetical protein